MIPFFYFVIKYLEILPYHISWQWLYIDKDMMAIQLIFTFFDRNIPNIKIKHTRKKR